MFGVPSTVFQCVKKLVPGSVLNEITCFAFYDNHPRDQRNIDIIVCTSDGQVKEFYQRDEISGIKLKIKPREVKIMRNSNCELYYLISSTEEIYILSRKTNIQVHRKVENIESYGFEDFQCKGKSNLKIICKDDAVPLIFDENFNCLEDKDLILNKIQEEEVIPLLTNLQRKLVEAKYCVKEDEKNLKELLKLRQSSAHSIYECCRPCDDTFIFNEEKVKGTFKLKTTKPWVKFCNKKIVIVLNVINDSEITQSIEDLHFLLHGFSQNCTVYKTNVFQKSHLSPYWVHKPNTYNMESKKEIAVVCVIDYKEINQSISSKVEFNGVICYKRDGKECLLPFDDIYISSAVLLSDHFEVLADSNFEDSNVVLAQLCTTKHVKLKLRNIRTNAALDLTMLDIFCKYLKMDPISMDKNIVIHRSSPYHPLNGLMVVLPENNVCFKTDVIISVYGRFTRYFPYVFYEQQDRALQQLKYSAKWFVNNQNRSSSQILQLLKIIYDIVPLRIIATPLNIVITSKNDDLSEYNEEINPNERVSNYTDYVSSIVIQLNSIMEYLDNCSIKMSESKNSNVHDKVGREIDLFANGSQVFVELRNKILKECEKCFEGFSENSNGSEV